MQFRHFTNIPMNGNFLKGEVNTLAEKMNINNIFKNFLSVLEKNKGRNGLSFKNQCRENASADLNCDSWWLKQNEVCEEQIWIRRYFYTNKMGHFS